MADLLSAMVQRSKQVADPLVASYASGNRPFTVRISRPAVRSTFNRSTRAFTNPDDQLLYQGPARIYTARGGVELEVGDERTTFSSARCSIDVTWTDTDGVQHDTVPPRVDDLLEVLDTAQSEGTHLSGRVFTVEDVEVGGHFAIGYVLTLSGAAPSRRNA